MAKTLYTAEATVTGGRANGHGVTSDGALEAQLRAPVEMGGDGGGTNPEQLFAIGYAACFEGALGVAARCERAAVADPERAVRIVEEAHKVCPYSNATRGNIDVRITANGRELAAGAAR